MSLIAVYARLYGAALFGAWRDVLRNLWTLLLPMALVAALLVLSQALGQLGSLGGILLSLALDALIASYLYVVGEIVASSRVTLDELPKSIGPYFWSVLNVFFVIWVSEALLGFALHDHPQRPVIFAIAYFLGFVLLNACPETIYQRRTYGGLATMQHSIAFIHENWIEWFVPNLLAGALFYFGIPRLLAQGVPWPLVAVASGGLLHVLMIFRGKLFHELDGSSHRQRMFRARSG